VKNFIFKSSSEAKDLPKIISMLNLLLNEQRNQRVDLASIISRLRLLSPTKVEKMIVSDDELNSIEEFPDS